MKCSELAQEAIDKMRQQRTADRRQRPARVVKKDNSGEKAAGFIKVALAAAGIFFFSSFVFISCTKFFASFQIQKQTVRSTARTRAIQGNTRSSASAKKQYSQTYKWVDKNGVVHLSNTKQGLDE
jgi:hypothetical protein